MKRVEFAPAAREELDTAAERCDSEQLRSLALESAVFVELAPNRVEGCDDASRATVWPDRLELATIGGLVTILYEQIAMWPRGLAMARACAAGHALQASR